MTASRANTWQKGRENFEQFWKQVAKKDQWFPSDISQLQMLFLGEKPACFRNAIAAHYKHALKKLGYVCLQDWIYDSNQIHALHRRYKKYFPTPLLPGAKTITEVQMGLFLGFPLSSSKDYARYEEIILPKDVKRRLKIRVIMESQKKTSSTRTFMQHLLLKKKDLGFDAAAIRWIRTKGLYPLSVSVYGIAWRDFGSCKRDSQMRFHILKRAYEQSGMKELIAPIIRKYPEVFDCSVTKK